MTSNVNATFRLTDSDSPSPIGAASTSTGAARARQNLTDRANNYEQWFDRTFPKSFLAERYPTWRASLGLFALRGGSTIVETGCQRCLNDPGSGSSTKIFALLLSTLGRGVLHSVDICADNLALAKAVVEQDKTWKRVEFHLSDSVEFLEKMTEPIDFVYLDSYDYDSKEPTRSLSQAHQLKELFACYNKLSDKAVILLDDNDLPGGGKTLLSKMCLYDRGWRCLIDLKQSLWVRSV